MPRLSKIAARHLKGRDFDEQLAGVDLFLGPNGSGKSSRLLAVTAGLYGISDSPTPSNSRQEYLGPERPEALVTLLWEDGTPLVRNLSQGPRTKAGQNADARASMLAGEALVRWDLADFARASEGDRAKLIERVCTAGGAAGGWDEARIRSCLRDELDLPLDGNGSAQVPTGHPLLDLVRAVSFAGRPVGEWLARALEWARGEYTAANAAQRETAHAAEAAERALQAPAPGGDLPAKRREVEDLERQDRAAGDALAGAEARARQAGDAAAEGERLAQAVGRAQDDVRVTSGRLAGLLTDEPVSVLADATAADQLAATALGLADRAAREARSKADAAHAACVTLEDLAGKAGANACIHCGAVDPLDLQARVQEASDLADAAGDTADDCDAAVTLARRALQRATDAVLRARERDTLVTQATAAEGAARKRLAEAEAALGAWQERQAAAPAAPGGDLEQLRADRAALAERLRVARGHVEALVRRETLATQHQRAVAMREKARARFDNVKALGEALKALQARVAADAYGPLQDSANRFLLEAGVPLVVLFRSAADFGAVLANETYVPYWSLSDSERALVGAALAVAFARLSRAPWVAVLLDGLERLDADRLPGVLRALAALRSRGEIDNAVLALVATDPAMIPAVEGVVAHWLGRAARAAGEAA